MHPHRAADGMVAYEMKKTTAASFFGIARGVIDDRPAE